MKRTVISLIICALLVLSCCGCSKGSFGHEIYDDIKDYSKIFELTELRYDEDAFEIFPKDAEGLDVSHFYCEWNLGAVGSAEAQICLSVRYDKEDLNAEIERLKSLGGGNMVFDTDNFQYPAYVSVLGYMNTNYYALVDKDNSCVHYILLQIINAGDVGFDKNYLPNGYGELGAVDNISYNIYE